MKSLKQTCFWCVEVYPEPHLVPRDPLTGVTFGAFLLFPYCHCYRSHSASFVE